MHTGHLVATLVYMTTARIIVDLYYDSFCIRFRMEGVKESKDYHFPTEEEAILKFWDATDAFKEQLRLTEGKPEYIFYDGPPFATGLPHYGHILAGTLKVMAQNTLACTR